MCPSCLPSLQSARENEFTQFDQVQHLKAPRRLVLVACLYDLIGFFLQPGQMKGAGLEQSLGSEQARVILHDLLKGNIYLPPVCAIPSA